MLEFTIANLFTLTVYTVNYLSLEHAHARSIIGLISLQGRDSNTCVCGGVAV